MSSQIEDTENEFTMKQRLAFRLPLLLVLGGAIYAVDNRDGKLILMGVELMVFLDVAEDLIRLFKSR